MRKMNPIVTGITALYAGLGLNPAEILHNTKLLLKQYRGIQWSVADRLSDLAEEYRTTAADFGTIGFFEEFLSEQSHERLKRKFSTAYDSRLLIDYVERALSKLKTYPETGALYHEILEKQYFQTSRRTESELLDALHIERSVFYDRKKEAVALYSVILWGYFLPAFAPALLQSIT